MEDCFEHMVFLGLKINGLMIRNTLLLFLYLSSSLLVSAATFYVDPINGDNVSGNGSQANPWKTLEYVAANGFIQSHSYVTPYDSNNPELIVKNPGAPIMEGDTILLFTGLHGEIFLQNYINEKVITVKAAEGNVPVVKSWHFQGARNWHIEEVAFSAEPYGEYPKGRLIWLQSHDWQGPVDNVVLKDNHFYSTESPWTEASEWVEKVSNGIYVQADSIQLVGNLVENIGFGITLLGDRNHALGNTISNFSGDGLRVLGSYNLVESNLIKNCYKVDDNHDDGIQSFTTGGLSVDHNQIIKNTIINYEDPNQPLLGDLQGIGCFDGPYNSWVVENNVISVNHWHGISIYGAKECRIMNNTVIDPDPNNEVGPSWILIQDDGDILAEGCIVKNNLTNSLNIDAASNSEVSNNILMNEINEYTSHFNDYSLYDFSLTSNSTAIDVGVGELAPSTDIVGSERPQGQGYDIGAYEFLEPVSVNDLSDQLLEVYPIPTNGELYFGKAFNDFSVTIYDTFGKVQIHQYQNQSTNSIDVSSLVKGMYIMRIQSEGQSFTVRFLKG